VYVCLCAREVQTSRVVINIVCAAVCVAVCVAVCAGGTDVKSRNVYIYV